MRNGPLRGMHRIRWVAGSEPEMQCVECLEYLPLTDEFWVPVHGIRRCRACWKEHTNRASRARRSDPAYRDYEREAARLTRKATADRTTYCRDYYRRRYSTLARFERSA